MRNNWIKKIIQKVKMKYKMKEKMKNRKNRQIKKISEQP